MVKPWNKDDLFQPKESVQNDNELNAYRAKKREENLSKFGVAYDGEIPREYLESNQD